MLALLKQVSAELDAAQRHYLAYKQYGEAGERLVAVLHCYCLPAAKQQEHARQLGPGLCCVNCISNDQQQRSRRTLTGLQVQLRDPPKNEKTVMLLRVSAMETCL